MKRIGKIQPKRKAMDFVLYGPIEKAPTVFPLVGMADMIVSEANKAEHEIEAQEPHPITKMGA